MRAYAIEAFSPIAVLAEKLVSILRETLFFQPSIHRQSTRNSSPMLFAIIINVVNCQELRCSLATTLTFAAISLQNFISQSRAIERIQCIDFGLAIIAKDFRCSTRSVAIRTNSLFFCFGIISFPIYTLTFFMPFERIGILQEALVFVFVEIRVASKRLYILYMTAISTAIAKTIAGSFERPKMFICSGFELLTFVATLQWGIVLGYTILHGRISNILSRPGVLAHYQDTPFLPHHYTINPLCKQLHASIGGL